MKLTLRQITGGELAFSVWLLSNGSTNVVRMSQEDKLACDAKNYDAFAPEIDAKFLMAGGGVPALDTADGWPTAGDIWQHDNDWHISLNGEIPWSYGQEIAQPPAMKNGKMQSKVDGFRLSQASVLRVAAAELTGKDSSDFSFINAKATELTGKISLVSGELMLEDPTVAAVQLQIVDTYSDNHRSVTFDATSNGSTSGSTLTIAHVVGSHSNLHLTVAAWLATGSGQTITGVTWNTSENLTFSLGNTQNSRRAELWYKLAPSVGSFNVVISMSGANSAAAGVVSAYGADQSTAYSNTATNQSLSATSATLTINSAVNELAIAFQFNRGPGAITVDGSWTSDYSNANAASGQKAGAHIAGASPSVSITNTMATAEYITIGASIKEAVANVGSAAGTGTATGVGASTAASAGSAAGTSTCTGTGASTAASAGAAAGTGAAAGVGASTAAAAGAAAGVGTATGFSPGGSAGAAAGTSTCTGTGASTAASAGAAAGTGAATGVGASTAAAAGAAAGVGTATGVGRSTAASAGAAAGTGAATGVGASTAASAGAAAGTGTAAGTGVALSRGAGTAAGTGAATAASVTLSVGGGVAAGIGSCLGVGTGVIRGVGSVTCVSTCEGFSVEALLLRIEIPLQVFQRVNIVTSIGKDELS